MPFSNSMHKDERYRWMLHRPWIAVGNEALAYDTRASPADPSHNTLFRTGGMRAV